MQIDYQEYAKHTIRTAGALLGAAGGTVASVMVSKRSFIVRRIVTEIAYLALGREHHPIARIAHRVLVEAVIGGLVGALIGLELTDRLTAAANTLFPDNRQDLGYTNPKK